MKITVFGGSQAQPGDPVYLEAMKLGTLLGANGFTVLSGGYIGIMEAVSRGAAEAGGHVIGVTCDEIEAWRQVRPNQWIKEEIRFPTIRQRLYALMENCDAAIAMPGGIGTLAEIAETWSHLQTMSIPSRPLILVGTGWESTMRTLFLSLGEYIPMPYRELLTFASDADNAFKNLQNLNLSQ